MKMRKRKNGPDLNDGLDEQARIWIDLFTAKGATLFRERYPDFAAHLTASIIRADDAPQQQTAKPVSESVAVGTDKSVLRMADLAGQNGSYDASAASDTVVHYAIAGPSILADIRAKLDEVKERLNALATRTGAFESTSSLCAEQLRALDTQFKKRMAEFESKVVAFAKKEDEIESGLDAILKRAEASASVCEAWMKQGFRTARKEPLAKPGFVVGLPMHELGASHLGGIPRRIAYEDLSSGYDSVRRYNDFLQDDFGRLCESACGIWGLSSAHQNEQLDFVMRTRKIAVGSEFEIMKWLSSGKCLLAIVPETIPWMLADPMCAGVPWIMIGNAISVQEQAIPADGLTMWSYDGEHDVYAFAASTLDGSLRFIRRFRLELASSILWQQCRDHLFSPAGRYKKENLSECTRCRRGKETILSRRISPEGDAVILPAQKENPK